MNTELFKPQSLNGYNLKNRIVMAPMTRNRADENGVPTDMMATYYAQRASAGLIISEATQISDRAKGYMFTPGMYTQAQVDGWRKVTDEVHQQGGVIFCQLFHVGRVSHHLLQPGGAPPMAPSALQANTMVFTPNGFEAATAPREIKTEEIPQLIEQFAHAARLAGEAGFDGVELHAANGYLIEQFLKDGTNQRTDAYGGSLENRLRFLLETVKAVVKVLGPDKVGVRITPRGTFNDMYDSDPKSLASAVAAALNHFPLAYLHVMDPFPDHPNFKVQEEAPRLLPLVREIYRGRVIACGGYDKPGAETALHSHEADLIAFGMAYVANPDLAERFQLNAALNEVDPATLYGGDEKGLTDYPFIA